MNGIRLTFALAGILSASLVWGHHSAGALYLMNRTIAVDGVVTEYRFVNPHVRLYVEVTTESGGREIWLAEGQSKNVLVREGWNGQELKVGDRVTLTGNPPRDGSRSIQWSAIALSDGTTLGGGTVKDFSTYIDRLRQR